MCNRFEWLALHHNQFGLVIAQQHDMVIRFTSAHDIAAFGAIAGTQPSHFLRSNTTADPDFVVVDASTGAALFKNFTCTPHARDHRILFRHNGCSLKELAYATANQLLPCDAIAVFGVDISFECFDECLARGRMGTARGGTAVSTTSGDGWTRRWGVIYTGNRK